MQMNDVVRNLIVVAAVSVVVSVGRGQCEPVEVARVAVGGDLHELASIGAYRYAAWGTEGLIVLEAEGPDDWTRVGSLDLGAEATSVEAGVGVVFVGAGTSVFAVDVSVPRYPRVLDSIELGDEARTMKVREDVLYVAAGDAGLKILNVENPSAMSIRATLSTMGSAHGVAAAGTKAYVTTADGGLVLDVSNPSSPVVLADDAPGKSTVRMTQSRAYVAQNGHVLIVDISTPTQPEVLASRGFAGSIAGLRVANGMLYVASESTEQGIGGCGDDVDFSRVSVVDVGGDTFATIAEEPQFQHSHVYTGLSLVDGRPVVIQSEPFSGMRMLEVSGSSVVEQGRFMGVHELTSQYRRSLATTDGTVFGVWYEDYTNRSSEAWLQAISFGDGGGTSLAHRPLPTAFPFTDQILMDGELAYIVVGQREGPTGADCFPDFGPTTVHAVDMSNPADPVVLGSTTINTFPDTARVALGSGARLYMTYRSLVDIYDSTDPAELELLGRFDYERPNSNYVLSHLASGEFVYLLLSPGIGGTSPLVQIYDTTEPDDVVLVSSTLTDWESMRMVGPYLVAGGADAFEVLDLSSPVEPIQLAEVSYAHAWSRSSVSGDFLAYGDDDNISVLDLSDPSNPRHVATLPGAEAFALSDDGATLFVLRDGAIVKHEVTPAGPLGILATAATADTAMDVSLAPNEPWAYVSDLAGGVRVFDVSNPAQPIAIDAFTELDRAYQTVVVGVPGGELGYIAGGASGLVVISAEIPTAHGLVAAYETSDLALALALGDGFAYVATRFDGLQVFDISVPGVITPVGSVDTPGSAQGVTVDGDLVYVADGSGGVHVVSVANRSLPTIVGSYDTPMSARQVVLYGSVALVPDRTTGLIALDVSDATDPRLIGTLGGLGDTRSVSISGHTAFVADFEGFVHRVDISNPAAMVLVESVATLGTPRAVTADGSLVYVADGDAGLTVLEARPCWDNSCPADVNGDDLLDFFDLQAFLNAYSAQGGLADWNDDGLLDFFDLLGFLGDFAAGCP